MIHPGLCNFSRISTLHFHLPRSILTLHSPMASLPILFFFLLSSAAAITHPDDLHLLYQLKSSISPSSIPPASCISSWNFSSDPCDNLFSSVFICGFRCDAVSNSSSRLTELTLDSAGYSANLSTLALPSNPFLLNLDFSNNNFYGSIPNSLSSLTSLRRLALSHNSLAGEIPASISALTNIQEIYLDSNYLSGPITPSLNALKTLKRLELQGNNFSGDIPQLSSLEALIFLDASDNSIAGEIPTALPPSLVELAVRNNQLTGNIPSASIAGLSSLQVLDLSHNRLSGAIPATLFAHPSLEQVTLSYNQFGSVQEPAGPVLGSQLISVDLSNNQIRGFLPGFMGQMPRLSALSLENNKFSGPIPTQYVFRVMDPGAGMGMGQAQFERLLLGGNYLFGPIPGAFLDLKAGSVTVRLGDNCLYRCPLRWFFCEGGDQKSLTTCRAFGPIIP